SLTPSVSPLTRLCISLSNCRFISSSISAAWRRNSFRCFFSLSGSVLGIDGLTYQVVIESAGNSDLNQVAALHCPWPFHENRAVHLGRVSLGTAACFAGVRIEPFDHNALNAANQGLVFFSRDNCLQIHHFLPAPLLFLLGDLSRHARRRGTLFFGVLKDSQAFELSFLYEAQKLGEVVFAFAGKAHDQRGAQGQTGNRLAKFFHRLANRAAALSPAHAPEHRLARVLKRDVEVLADPAACADHVEERRVEEIGIGV